MRREYLQREAQLWNICKDIFRGSRFCIISPCQQPLNKDICWVPWLLFSSPSVHMFWKWLNATTILFLTVRNICILYPLKYQLSSPFQVKRLVRHDVFRRFCSKLADIDTPMLSDRLIRWVRVNGTQGVMIISDEGERSWRTNLQDDIKEYFIRVVVEPRIPAKKFCNGIL